MSRPTPAACGWLFARRTVSGSSKARICCRPSAASRIRRRGPGFTHLSYDDYRILHAKLIKHEKASTRDRIVPYTVFIDPQPGRAGLTEREARAQGRAIRVAKLPMSAVIRAIETGETRGFMKAVAPWRTRSSLTRSWRKASTPSFAMFDA